MRESTVPAKTEQRVPDTHDESRILVPPVDIFETDEGLCVVADVPGVTKDAIDVSVDDEVLTIKAAAKSELPGTPVREEYELLNFYRQFQLSDAVDRENIQADLKHGVLVIRLPKKEAAKPKQIAVKVSG